MVPEEPMTRIFFTVAALPSVPGYSIQDSKEMRVRGRVVVIGNLTVSENPDMDPGDESRTGPEVAKVPGPWVVDLTKGGPLPGKGGSDEQAVAIASIQNQNLKSGAAFDRGPRPAGPCRPRR